ncbi:MAG: hypothetical protein IAE78_09975 [Myxococcus sp.]|nr:hypothetical protein [Myxococcus sp.]
MPPRLRAFGLLLVATVSGGLSAWSRGFLGFPDGHLTEVERVDSLVLLAFIAVCVAVGLGAAVVVVRPARAPMLRFLAIGWAVALASVLVLHLVAARTLDGGGGG